MIKYLKKKCMLGCLMLANGMFFFFLYFNYSPTNE